MKKLFIFILLVAGGFFAYKYFIEEKTVLEIHANKSISTEHSMDIDAPALSPSRFGYYSGYC
ncbi:MAG: hypothetical protein M5T52_07530 [Ignavibacteriaceae bacterium]|nr:hypothetical protein [Ignavibacteriaceae bacterium]